MTHTMRLALGGVVLAGVLVAATIALSAQFTVYGPVSGTQALSCEAFLQNRNRETRVAYEWWAMGFVSGSSREFDRAGRRLKVTDTKAVLAWLDTHCRAHPQNSFVSAVMELVDELGDQPR